jgi:hypothetical protein
MLPSSVCAALADADRLRLFGTISKEPSGVAVADLQLGPRGQKALAKLLRAGLVERAADRYLVRPEVFRQALADEDRPAGVAGGGVAGGGVAGASVRVAALFSRGRLVSMPRPGALRTELLRYLAERFQPGRTYSEREVGEQLEPTYSDHAALRRYLVDEGIMARDNLGTYWRADEAGDGRGT